MTFRPLLVKPLYKGREETKRVIALQKEVGDFEFPLLYIANDNDPEWSDILDHERGDRLILNPRNSLSSSWNMAFHKAREEFYSHLFVLSNDVVLPHKHLMALHRVMKSRCLDILSPEEAYLNRGESYGPNLLHLPPEKYMTEKEYRLYSQEPIVQEDTFFIRNNIFFSCALFDLKKEYAPFDENMRIYYNDVDFTIQNYYYDYAVNMIKPAFGTCREIKYLHVRDTAHTISTSSRAIASLVDDLVSDAEVYYNKYKKNWVEVCQWTKLFTGLNIAGNLTPSGRFNAEALRTFEMDYKIMERL